MLPFVRRANNETGQSEQTAAGEQALVPARTTLDPTMESFKREVFDTAELFESFWMRFNKARIDVACLREEKQQLIDRNEQLKAHLKDYLITVNMNSGGPVESNADLLAKRPTSMRIEKLVRVDEEVIVPEGTRKAVRFRAGGQQQRRPVTCIEGNLSNAIRNERLLEVRAKSSEIYSMVPNRA